MNTAFMRMGQMDGQSENKMPQATAVVGAEA